MAHLWSTFWCGRNRGGVPKGSSAGGIAWDAAKSNRRVSSPARAWGPFAVKLIGAQPACAGSTRSSRHAAYQGNHFPPWKRWSLDSRDPNRLPTPSPAREHRCVIYYTRRVWQVLYWAAQHGILAPLGGASLASPSTCWECHLAVKQRSYHPAHAASPGLLASRCLRYTHYHG